MTSLQLGLIAAGVVLIACVVLYNWAQHRKLRRRIDPPPRDETTAAAAAGRIEPTLAGAVPDRDTGPASRANVLREDATATSAQRLAPEGDVAPAGVVLTREDVETLAAAPQSRAPSSGESAAQPDPDIECLVTLQRSQPMAAAELGPALQLRVGKPVRWFARETTRGAWEPLQSDHTGPWTEFAACMLLADRAGAVTKPQLERFIRQVSDQAAGLRAECLAPDADTEVARAEALDRLCADVDVQIGLTLLKPGPVTIPGTRLRGVAEAAGFHLNDDGRFELMQEDSGQLLYTLQNLRGEPFTADGLRGASLPGVVLVLDVPRVTEPVRVFDQMKLAAKRLAQTLDAALVDDNRRPLTDPALAAIRAQVGATAAALKAMNVDPGSPRALALFGG